MIDTTSSRELDLRIIGKVILGYMCPGGRDVRVGEIAPILLTFISEPHPKSISAVVGEKIHFKANFYRHLSSYGSFSILTGLLRSREAILHHIYGLLGNPLTPRPVPFFQMVLLIFITQKTLNVQVYTLETSTLTLRGLGMEQTSPLLSTILFLISFIR